MRSLVLPLLIVVLLTGCHKKPAQKPVQSYRFQNCKVVTTEIDRDGNERKNCDCTKGKEVGIDASTGAKLIWCEAKTE